MRNAKLEGIKGSSKGTFEKNNVRMLMVIVVICFRYSGVLLNSCNYY